MSNRVDFFIPAEESLSIPSCRLCVFLEDGLCTWLEVTEVVRAGWPEFGWAKLEVNTAGGNEELSFEELEQRIEMGKPVEIRQVFNELYPAAGLGSVPLFYGWIEEIEKELSSEGLRIEIKVRDFSSKLERIRIYGREVLDIDGSLVFLPGVDTVFNEDGRANGSAELKELGGRTCRLFRAENTGSEFWSYAEIIDYLLQLNVSAGQLSRPGREQLEALTEGQQARDLDLTGMNLLEAVHQCCEQSGIAFKFRAVSIDERCVEAIEFYRPGGGREVEINAQQPGEQINVSKTDIVKLESCKSFWPVTHKYIGQGDFKVFEGTFELVKGWDGSLEDTDYDKFSPSSNPQFQKVRDVYRRWVLNEAGDYSGAPYNRGSAFDFSKLFGSKDFIHRRRRFYPALSFDDNGKSLGYVLEVSYDGENWRQYLYGFDNLLDECGVWLSSDRLDVDTWVAALKGVLRFRITASVIADERLSCSVADGPVNSTAEVEERIISVPRRFKYRKVSSESIFSGRSADEADDGAELNELVRKVAGNSAEPFEKFDVRSPSVRLGYRVGDVVTSSPASRGLLGVKYDSSNVCRVDRVRMDFKGQFTELEIHKRRKVYV